MLTNGCIENELLRVRKLEQLSGRNGTDLLLLQHEIDEKREAGLTSWSDGKTGIWEDKYTPGLIPFKPRREQDLLSEWLVDVILPAIIGRIKFGEKSIIKIQESKIGRFVSVISFGCACLFPYGVVVVLYYLHSAWKKLVVVGAAGFLFSLAVYVMAQTRRVDAYLVSCA